MKLSTSKLVSRIDDDGIGWIIFNQPEKHNAMSVEMWQGLNELLAAYSEDRAVRVAIMRGAGGKSFISGADISEFDSVRSSAQKDNEYSAMVDEASRSLATFEKPLIALIEGFCIGGGLAVALAADVRFATPDSRFGIPAARLGLGYRYSGIAKLARVVGPAAARDVMFSARLLDASQARDVGLVNFLSARSDIQTETMAYARRIASNAPLTIEAAKAALNAWERGERAEDLREVRRLVDRCFDSADYEEGRRAFKEKRTPDFAGE